MKAYNPKDWFSLIFDFHKSYALKMLFPAICGLILYTATLCYLNLGYDVIHLRGVGVLHSLLGFVISLLLVFRTNTAYDRWWEGRKLWGDIVNNSRNLVLKISTLIPIENKTAIERISLLVTNYVIALRDHLRDKSSVSALLPVQGINLENYSNVSHLPNAVMKTIFKEIIKLKNEGLITDQNLLYLNEELRSFTNVVGACERIRLTPIPYSYSMFIKKFIFLYVVTLPFGLIEDFSWVSIPMVVFVFYAFASLELMAEEIEDPFGTEENDLPTDEIVIKIEKHLAEIIFIP